MLTAAAFLFPLIVIILSGNSFIRFIKKINFGQQIRELGPEEHKKKSGIPTMGGFLIIGSFIVFSVILVPLNIKTITILSTSLIMALTGFIDDFLKIKKQRSLGLKALEKIFMQTAAALIPAVVITFFLKDPIIAAPFLGDLRISLTLKFILTLFVVIGTSNAVNLTDGLDGLAAGVSTIVSLAFAYIFHISNLPNLMLLMLIMAGSCTAFLWFNSNPAQIFMGDIGSLGIGGFLAAAAVLSGMEIYLFIIGIIYVAETISVMIQVPYFKITGGKRIFKMTPIHHHFELKGLHENKIVFRFIIITAAASVFAVLALIK